MKIKAKKCLLSIIAIAILVGCMQLSATGGQMLTVKLQQEISDVR